VLKANFMQPVIQITNNIFGGRHGTGAYPCRYALARNRPILRSLPGSREPAPGPNRARENRLVVTTTVIWTISAASDEIGAGVSEGQLPLSIGVELLDRQPYESAGQQFADARPSRRHDWRSSR